MTQSQLILGHLQKYGWITPMAALQLFGCFRLAARIEEWRKKGYPIKTTMVSNGDVTYARYTLEGE